jgi:hypothetical protein
MSSGIKLAVQRKCAQLENGSDPLKHDCSAMVSAYMSEEINKAVQDAIKDLINRQFNDLIKTQFLTLVRH